MGDPHSSKKASKYGFVFRQLDRTSREEEWEVHNDDTILGAVYRRGERWGISSVGTRYDTKIDLARYSSCFPTKDDAAYAIFLITTTIDGNPLPSDFKDYLSERARMLREERKEYQGRLFALQREMAFLEASARKHGVEYDFGMDIKKEVQDLAKFLDENLESLYEHQGKDFARSLRAHVASVVKLIDPEVALDL